MSSCQPFPLRDSLIYLSGIPGITNSCVCLSQRYGGWYLVLENLEERYQWKLKCFSWKQEKILLLLMRTLLMLLMKISSIFCCCQYWMDLLGQVCKGQPLMSSNSVLKVVSLLHLTPRCFNFLISSTVIFQSVWNLFFFLTFLRWSECPNFSSVGSSFSQCRGQSIWTHQGLHQVCFNSMGCWWTYANFLFIDLQGRWYFLKLCWCRLLAKHKGTFNHSGTKKVKI